MDSVLKMDIFFVVTTIAVVIATIALVVIAVLVFKIVRDVREIISDTKEIAGRIKEEGGEIIKDISAARAKSAGLVSTLIATAITSAKAFSIKKRRRRAKAEE